MNTLSRRELLVGGGVSLMGSPEDTPQRGHSSLLWDEGGINPCRMSVEWCISRFPELSWQERDYFLEQWQQYQGVGYDPSHPLVSRIADGDEWQSQFFGGGELVHNIIARPSMWRQGRSLHTITMRKVVGGGTHIIEVTVPKVCKNTSCRKRKVGSVHCIPPEAYKNCVPATKKFHS